MKSTDWINGKSYQMPQIMGWIGDTKTKGSLILDDG
jgi:hypothetical protein